MFSRCERKRAGARGVRHRPVTDSEVPDGVPDRARGGTCELTASLKETIEKQHAVFTCEAERAGGPVPAMPGGGAEPCIQVTACEVEVAAR